MATKKDATVIAGKAINFKAVMRIALAVLFICISISGFVSGRGASFIGNLYEIIAEEFFIYIVAVIMLLCGAVLLLTMFMKGISPKIVKLALTIIKVFWIVFILLADFFPGFKGFSGSDWIDWLQGLMYHFIVLLGIFMI